MAEIRWCQKFFSRIVFLLANHLSSRVRNESIRRVLLSVYQGRLDLERRLVHLHLQLDRPVLEPDQVASQGVQPRVSIETRGPSAPDWRTTGAWARPVPRALSVAPVGRAAPVGQPRERRPVVDQAHHSTVCEAVVAPGTHETRLRFLLTGSMFLVRMAYDSAT